MQSMSSASASSRWSSAPPCASPARLKIIPQFYQLNIGKLGKSKSKSKYNNCKLRSCLKLGVEDIAGIAHNKVFIAAALSAAIGQLSKPFTCSLFYSKPFNLKAVFQAGGFPSTHSSAVAATATCIALERGFSDSIFGLALVYASLVMYDAQGVRREVGNHAKALNVVVPKTQVTSMVSKDDTTNHVEEVSSSLKLDKYGPLLSKDGRATMPTSTNSTLLLKSDNEIRDSTPVMVSSSITTAEEGKEKVSSSASPWKKAIRHSEFEEGTEKVPYISAPLNESIGHSEVEVTAGALLGLFVSMAVYAIL